MKKTRVVFGSVVLVTVLFVLGCIAAIPVAVIYYEDSQKYTATADLPVSPDEVYRTAVNLAEERKLKILKKDDAARSIEVSDGKETAALKVTPIGGDKAQIVVTSDTPRAKDRKEEEKKLAFRAIDALCTKLNVKYTLVKQ